MDLNIIRVALPLNGRPITSTSEVHYRYVGKHDIVERLQDAQLAPYTEATDAVKELSQRMGMANAKFEIIQLKADTDLNVKVNQLTKWSEVTDGEVGTVKNFLDLNYVDGDYKASNSAVLSGENQYYVSKTISNRLQVVVSVPGYFSNIDGLDVKDYGFSRVVYEPVGYGVSMFTVFTFTE